MSVGENEGLYSVAKEWRSGNFAHKATSPLLGVEKSQT
jgi:hypothetical protein